MNDKTPTTVGPGDQAPGFTLPAIQHDGTVELHQYRGKPLLLALFRGTYCAFCRRHIAQLGGVKEKLAVAGVDTLCVVATAAPRARTYFRVRPAPVTLAADLDAVTHQAYGLPIEPMTQTTAVVAMGHVADLVHPLAPDVPKDQVLNYLALKDGLPGGMTQTDMDDFVSHGHLSTGQFLIDSHGIVRWTSVEGRDTEVGGFPSESELLEAVATL